MRVRTVKMASDEGEFDVFGMAPWNPDPAPTSLTMPAIRNPRDIFLSSEEYIAVLESKLKKITRQSDKAPSSKEMIRCLMQSKESQMKNLTEKTNEPYVSNHEFVAEDQETKLAALQRKLHPEKQALNPEEKKYLVENDELGRMVLEMKSEEQELAKQDWKRRLSHPNLATHQKHSNQSQESIDMAESNDDELVTPGHEEGELGDPGPEDESQLSNKQNEGESSTSHDAPRPKEEEAIETKEENTAECKAPSSEVNTGIDVEDISEQ